MLRRVSKLTWLIFCLLIVGAFALAVAGCGGDTSSTDTTVATTSSTSVSGSTDSSTDTTSKVAVSEWNIPCLNILSGAYGGFGAQIQWMLDRAVGEINAAGGAGGVPIKLDVRDTASDPAKATAELAKVVDKGLLCIGPFTASETKAAMPLAVEHKMFIITPWQGTAITAEFAPYMTHWTVPFSDGIPPAVEAWAALYPEMKTVAQFCENADTTWTEIAAANTLALEKSGVKMTQIDVQAGVDLGSVVVKALSGKPDGICIVCSPANSAKIAVELDKRGFTDHTKILYYFTVDDPALFKGAGAALNGSYIYAMVNNSDPNPRFQTLRAAWEEFSGDPGVSAIAIGFYDYMYLTARCIDETGITGDPAKLVEERQKITDWWQNVKAFEGATGTWDLVNGYCKTPLFLEQITDGVARTYKLIGTYPPSDPTIAPK